MGIPIICNDIGDTGEIVKEAGAGLVIKNFSMDAYREVVEKLTATSEMDKEKIRQSAFEYYDLRNGVNEYLAVYKRMAE